LQSMLPNYESLAVDVLLAILESHVPGFFIFYWLWDAWGNVQVFEYFSSVRREDGQTFMTAADLMRAIVPVFPPSGSHLVREGSLGGERSPGDLKCPPSKFFMLFDTNGDGLISFPE
jgi:hypothetical protein